VTWWEAALIFTAVTIPLAFQLACLADSVRYGWPWYWAWAALWEWAKEAGNYLAATFAVHRDRRH
jgi:hypothetical protein